MPYLFKDTQIFHSFMLCIHSQLIPGLKPQESLYKYINTFDNLFVLTVIKAVLI